MKPRGSFIIDVQCHTSVSVETSSNISEIQPIALLAIFSLVYSWKRQVNGKLLPEFMESLERK